MRFRHGACLASEHGHGDWTSTGVVLAPSRRAPGSPPSGREPAASGRRRGAGTWWTSWVCAPFDSGPAALDDLVAPHRRRARGARAIIIAAGDGASTARRARSRSALTIRLPARLPVASRSRSARFSTLPLAVRGRSSVTTTRRSGSFRFERPLREQVRGHVVEARARRRPDRRRSTAHAISPAAAIGQADHRGLGHGGMRRDQHPRPRAR